MPTAAPRRVRCTHCRRKFIPDPRVGKRQKYCERSVCRKASRAAAQKRWLRRTENRHHFRGLAHVYRVREWRRVNPGYWRRRAEIGRYTIRGELGRVVGEGALQDMIDSQFSLLIGLISHLIKSPLQDEIARELRRLILLGHGILTQITTPSTTRGRGGSP